MNYTLNGIASIVNGEIIGNKYVDAEVRNLLFDSRLFVEGENTLFFALAGTRNDGHRYIAELLSKGVRMFVVDKSFSNFRADASFIVVADTLASLQRIAAYHRRMFKIPVVGITGSNGKTVVKEWLYQILSPSLSVVRSPKSYNSQIGVPLSVWQMDGSHEIALFEAGISQPGEMQRLNEMILPTIGVFTNIGTAHGKNFSSTLHKIEEKMSLFSTDTQRVVFCSDNDELQKVIHDRNIGGFSWSRRHHDADLFIRSICHNGDAAVSTTICAEYQGRDVSITIPFFDEASVENAITCWCVALLLGLPDADITDRMSRLESVEMRMELKAGVRNCLIINDSYNNDINAFSIALDFLNAQHHDKKVVVLSEILQSELNEETLYEKIAQLVSNKGVDTFIGIGASMCRNKDKFKTKSSFFESTDSFLSNYPMKEFDNQIVLLKGARRFHFEKIMKVLQQKSHETVLEVNLDNIAKNLSYYRSKLRKDTKVMVMVKAFAYGSGNFEVSNLLAFHNVDYLTVAYADEGVELRNKGIRLPIMVMTPETNTFDAIIKNGLEPDIYSFRCLSQLEDAVNQSDISDSNPVGIHIKLDTGMHRLGFLPEDIDEIVDRVRSNPKLRIRSVFSHLATSDMPNENDFTLRQITAFEEMSRRIVESFPYKILRHILNTAGVSRFSDYQYDMVRLGIGAYGVAICDDDKGRLHNVMSLKSTIKQIKEYEAGETVGYGRNGKITKRSRIGVIPMGYADGLRRQLGNGNACFWVNGKAAPIIGNVCMDLCMIDVTDIDCQEDDTAVLFDDEHTVDVISDICGTIPYEIMTGISQRVKRVYVKE
ncbi:MAG: bifunctional UDP-N-acetylmuramoyl-tripeptide:D-alanyl-D-alanine ligase/alanine racemase [Candidatus Limimorpha sp.]